MKQLAEAAAPIRNIPAKMGDLLKLLPSSVQAALVEQTRPRYAADGQFESDFVGYRIKHDVPKADLETAWRQVRVINQPADGRVVLAELVRLRALTKMRAESEADSKVMIAALAEELAPYPIDIIQDACRRWSRMEKWFPAWAELKDMLDFRVARRKRLEEALAEAIER